MDNANKKILIIEDEDALASVLLAKLKLEKYDVKIEYNGEDGFNRIKEWQPDLILLDIVMPKMNGYEVLERMKDEKVKIPVIIISNSGQPVEIEKAMQLGAVDCIVKTEFDPSEVINRANKYLGKSEAKEPGAEDKGKKDDKGKVSADTIKVLLCEDDSFLREICSKKLTKEGYQVFDAADGEEALKVLEKEKVDAVLLDIILPSMDGFEVLKRIRSHKNASIKKVPIIMLSNLSQEDDVSKAMALGANNYLVKAHFTTDEIIDKIKNELEIK